MATNEEPLQFEDEDDTDLNDLIGSNPEILEKMLQLARLQRELEFLQSMNEGKNGTEPSHEREETGGEDVDTQESTPGDGDENDDSTPLTDEEYLATLKELLRLKQMLAIAEAGELKVEDVEDEVEEATAASTPKSDTKKSPVVAKSAPSNEEGDLEDELAAKQEAYLRVMRDNMVQLQAQAEARSQELNRLLGLQRDLMEKHWGAFHRRLVEDECKTRVLIVIDNLYSTEDMRKLDLKVLQEELQLPEGSSEDPSINIGIYALGVDLDAWSDALEHNWFAYVSDSTGVETDVVSDLLEFFILHRESLVAHFIGCDYQPYIPILKKALKHEVNCNIHTHSLSAENPTHAVIKDMGIPIREIRDVFE